MNTKLLVMDLNRYNAGSVQFSGGDKKSPKKLQENLNLISDYLKIGYFEKFSKPLRECNTEHERKFIFASNKAEGSKLGKRDTYMILSQWQKDGKLIIEDCKREIEKAPKQQEREIPPGKREVLQHHLALYELRESCKSSTPHLSNDLISKIHKILMDGLLDDDGRDINVGIYRTEHCVANGGMKIYLTPKFIQARMDKMIADFEKYIVNNSIDTCLIAGWLLAEFLTIHPFNDGNGRLARLLFNYCLWRRGLDLVFLMGNKNYIKSLKRYQKYLDPSQKLSFIWLYSTQCVINSFINLRQFCSENDEST